jgi:PAS domain S-box-containing protein
MPARNIDAMSAEELKKMAHELRVYQIELEMQNQEILRTRVELEQSHADYADLYDFAPVGYLTIDRSGMIHKSNLTACAILGVEREKLMGMPLSAFFAPTESQNVFYLFLRRVFSTGGHRHCIVNVTKGREQLYARLESGPRGNNTAGDDLCRIALSVVHDQIMVEELKDLIEKKEMFIKEVHHRVKNNLQTLLSLVGLQEQKAGGSPAARELAAIGSRIRAMAIIHEKLLSGGDLSRVDLYDYLLALATELRSSLLSDDRTVALEIDVQKDLAIPVGIAMPLGLAVNEIITNSLTHAFPSGYRGEGAVIVSAHAGASELDMAVADNGVGMPAGVDGSGRETLGLTLIKMIIEKQLGGVLERIEGQGTRYRISIPLER